MLGAIWLCGKPLSLSEISQELCTRFYVNLDPGKVKQQADQLCQNGMLVSLPGGELKVSERAIEELEEEVKEAEEIESKAKGRFLDLFRKCCPALAADEGWESFNVKLLLPLVREIGARTYQLICGTALNLEATPRFLDFLATYPPEDRQSIRTVIVSFLDPTDPCVRSYVLRNLNAHFFLEAGNLHEHTIAALAAIAKNPPSFKIFVDTNFLFSFLGLHENPSNEAAKYLMEMTAQLSAKVSCKFYVSTLTLDETKRVIGWHRDSLRGLSLTPKLAQAALDTGLTGIARKFVDFQNKVGHPVRAEDYFGPYLTDLIPTLRAKNVELFNESLERYGTQQGVVDDILAQFEHEKERYGVRAKRYEELEHDVILWHFVRDKRPSRLESPLEATYWIVTVDYHLLGFDLFKRRNAQNQIPNCLHPTTLIQMLQFWLPRTPEFDEAVLGSLRLPFLFQEFDPAAEKVTVRILEALARFENINELPREVVTAILVNEALRQKVALEGDEQKQVELVKQALIEENGKIRSQLTSANEEASRLKRELAQKDRENTGLDQRLAEQVSKVAQAERELGEERRLREQVEARLERLEQRLNEDRIARQRKREIGTFVAGSTVLLLLALSAPAALLFFWRHPWGSRKAVVVGWALLLLLWTRLADASGQSRPAVKEWRPYVALHRVKGWVFLFCYTVITGASGNALYDWLKSWLK